MAWYRFWERASWEEWRQDRQGWAPYAEQRKLLRSQRRAAGVAETEARARHRDLETRLGWARLIGPTNVLIETAKSEQGLAGVGGVTLQEIRGGQNPQWTPVGSGAVYFTDRRMVFLGSKKVEFRFDDIEGIRSGHNWLEIAVGRRKKPSRLSGPSDQLMFTLQEVRQWNPSVAPSAKYQALLLDAEAKLEAQAKSAADLESQLSSLEKPKRPISPAWVPGLLLATMAFAGGNIVGGNSAQRDLAAATSTTALAPISDPAAPNTTSTTIHTATTAVSETSTTTSDASDIEVIAVTDGDTVEVRLADGTVESLRLIGVNAPEPGECFADESATALSSLLTGHLVVESDVTDRDQFGRLLRYLFADGAMVNVLLVESGFAFSHHYHPDTAHQGEIDQAQARAQAARTGIWGSDVCGPTFAAPLEIAGLGYNPPGDESQQLNEEWIAIRNQGTIAVDLTGWQIRDESAAHRFHFPVGFTLAPGALVAIHSGCGEASAQQLYWCSVGSAIWNNTGDTVFVHDPNGNIHIFLTYDSSRTSDDLLELGITPPTTSTTIAAPATTTTKAPSGNCHSSYPTVCIPPAPPDLDCGEISYRNFTVVGSDPHGFDRDNDGIGCES